MNLETRLTLWIQRLILLSVTYPIKSFFFKKNDLLSLFPSSGASLSALTTEDWVSWRGLTSTEAGASSSVAEDANANNAKQRTPDNHIFPNQLLYGKWSRIKITHCIYSYACIAIWWHISRVPQIFEISQKQVEQPIRKRDGLLLTRPLNCCIQMLRLCSKSNFWSIG